MESSAQVDKVDKSTDFQTANGKNVLISEKGRKLVEGLLNEFHQRETDGDIENNLLCIKNKIISKKPGMLSEKKTFNTSLTSRKEEEYYPRCSGKLSTDEKKSNIKVKDDEECGEIGSDYAVCSSLHVYRSPNELCETPNRNLLQTEAATPELRKLPPHEMEMDPDTASWINRSNSLKNNSPISIATLSDNTCYNHLLACTSSILQVHKNQKLTVELLDVLLMFAKGNCSAEFLHCDVGEYLWLKLLLPKELIQTTFTCSLSPDQVEVWSVHKWWSIYARGIELVTLLLQKHSHYFLKEVLQFVGIHEEYLVDSLLLGKQSLEPIAMDLIKCAVTLVATLVKFEKQWRLEHWQSLFNLMVPEINAEFYALKGLLLAKIGRSEVAGKAFSAAVQLHDGLTKAWAMWGDYMEQMFSRHKQIALGVSAITCYLHACHQSESKTPKYLAKVLWLLSYDNTNSTLMSTLDKYVMSVPHSYLLPWIPQLLCCLVQYEGNVILNLRSHQVGRLYPQAVYFPIRTLYLTLKIEQSEKHKAASGKPAHSHNLESYMNQVFTSSASTSNPAAGPASVNSIKATPPMWMCSKVMHVKREIYPIILSSLEGIVDQTVWFREMKPQLHRVLYILSKSWVRRSALVIENIPDSVASSTSNSAASESLARRAQVTFQDPAFQLMKEQFTRDFDFTKPGAMKLHNLITKLKSWIKALEIKVKKLPTSFLIEDKCRFLSNFSQKTAEVELPGDTVFSSLSHSYISFYAASRNSTKE
uniref:PIK-related kinase FAT domain-containing protein n=1 Tax=Glossina pallidipes TaxID=7398 RepID=A0A1B0A5M8_GLOPL